MKAIVILVLLMVVGPAFGRNVTLNVSDDFSEGLKIVTNFDGSITASNIWLNADGKLFPVQQDGENGAFQICKKLGKDSLVTWESFSGNSYFNGVITLDQNGALKDINGSTMNYYGVIDSVTCR